MKTKKEIIEENFYEILERKIYTSDDKEFIKFINDDFYKLSSKKVIQYKENLETLKKMDSELLATVSGRLSYLEESKDTLKSLTFFSGITLIMLSSYISFVELFTDFEKISPIISFLIILCLFISFAIILGNSRHEKSLVIYFKSLISSLH